MIFSAFSIRQKNGGITLVEVLVSISISVFILAGAVGTYIFFKNIRNTEALNNAGNIAKFRLEEARSLTLSSKDSSVYGVHFETSAVVLFKGNTYVAGASTNDVSSLGPYATISTSLNGGGSDVVFSRLTGETTQNGTITAAEVADPTKTITITLSQTGFVSLQSP